MKILKKLILSSTFILLIINLIILSINSVSIGQNGEIFNQPKQQYKRQTKATISITSSQTKFTSPYLILMSKNEISIAQLPLIDNGAVSIVYTLNNTLVESTSRDFANINENNSNHDDEGYTIGTGSLLAPRLPADAAISSSPASGPSTRTSATTLSSSSMMPMYADAREYEQMPPLQTQQTTTSLGKSEWQQQIATKSNNNKSSDTIPDDINSPNINLSKATNIEQEVVGGSAGSTSNSTKTNSASVIFKERNENDGNAERKEVSGLRKRRSNSLAASNDDVGDYGRGNSLVVNNGIASSASSSSSSFLSGKDASESLRSTTRGVRKKRNVTSARFARGTQETTTALNREEVEKRKHNEGYSNIPSPHPADDDKNSDVQFSDFDVHMDQGCAFVSDSLGRIHKFGLSGSESEPTMNLAGSLMFGKSSKENDQANTIDVARAKSSTQFDDDHPGKFASNNAFFNAADVPHSQRDETKNDIGAAINNDSNDAVNKVLDGNTNTNGVTHEQSGRHPTTSGLRSPLLASEVSSDVALNMEATFHVNQLGQPQHGTHSLGPRIIWSRIKHGFSETQFETEQKSSRGAFPLSGAATSTDNQMANDQKHMGGAAASANEITSTDEEADEEELQQLSRDNTSSNHENEYTSRTTGGSISADRSLTSQLASGKKKPGTHLRTEIAVDWLNNLLFVLDKYRLFVVDLDGNNELVLIDDFNQNNRPIDIKVDPVNNFLFWLQVGNFHNTIYKLDLGVLSMQSIAGKLSANTSKLSNLSQHYNGRQIEANSDVSSEFVALISHHYAHPIVTNLPQYARLFTIDHKHSRIYVPLPARSKQNKSELRCNKSNDKEEIEVNRTSDEAVTHMNNTSSNETLDQTSNCTTNFDYYPSNAARNDQILAYNLDGTDVGPLRSADEKTHLTGLNEIEDITMDTDKGYLYWLTNNGTELFEEFKSDSDPAFYSALHNLEGKKYRKLMYFGSNQPRNQKPRINLRIYIQLLSSTTSNTNRQIRSDGIDLIEEARMASSLHNNSYHEANQFSRNTPYIIAAISSLIVLSIYLVYSFVVNPQNRQDRSSPDHRDDSISGISSMSGSQLDYEVTGHSFVGTNTIPKLIVDPPTRTLGTSPARYPESPRVDSFTIDSTNFNSIGNTLSEHYGGMGITTLSKFPSNISYMPNEHYVPIEVLGNEALSSIRRIGLDQLKIDEKCIGRGHFAEVKLGKIACNNNEENCPLHGSKLQGNKLTISVGTETPAYATTIFDDVHQKAQIQSSIGSSGHGSSSTSSEFVAVTSTLDASNGDYLMPKSQCDSNMSDYAVDQTFARPDSYCSYYNSSVCPSTVNNHHERFKSDSCSESDQSELVVAIKQLKINANDDEKMDFLNEAIKLANLNHPNVVQLVGICFDMGQKMIIMELMNEGDLIRYMKTNPTNLTEDDLLKICLDIVNGCCCLEREGVVHRDLAARNCLVTTKESGERVVKLADFGLARDIHKDSHYKKLTDSPMPLKWMAPESLSLSQRKFTTKSDVWSFGVVMWEVMKKCMDKPFADEDPGSMLKILESGHRLKKPDNCCEELYKLMTDCWQLEEIKRPTFQECRAELIEIKNSRSQ